MQTPAVTEQPLCQIVPLAEFKLPATPAQEAATKRLHAFWRLFHAEDVPAQTPAKAEEDLRTLPEVQLAHMAPPIEWRFAAEALDIRLGEWEQPGDAAERLRFLIGQPHGGQGESLGAWAAARDWTLIAPPTSEQILASDQAWLTGIEEIVRPPGLLDWASKQDGWVLPQLERCFLRHGEGLTLVRRFLDLAVGGRLGRGVIGCDSWAWTFLQRIWTVPQPEVFTLQAFDGSSLAAYFRRFLHDPAGRRVCVRNARTGEDVLSYANPDAGSGVEVSSDLKRLASRCRGNLGIAWTYWRTGLRTEPDSTAPADASTDGVDIKEASPSDEVTLWWEAERKEPAMSPETADNVAHVLHALLLHNGLSGDLLAEVLPGSRLALSAILQRLKRLGLIECVDDTWRVAALGYEAAREFLRGRSYLIDPL